MPSAFRQLPGLAATLAWPLAAIGGAALVVVGAIYSAVPPELKSDAGLFVTTVSWVGFVPGLQWIAERIDELIREKRAATSRVAERCVACGYSVANMSKCPECGAHATFGPDRVSRMSFHLNRRCAVLIGALSAGIASAALAAATLPMDFEKGISADYTLCATGISGSSKDRESLCVTWIRLEHRRALTRDDKIAGRAECRVTLSPAPSDDGPGTAHGLADVLFQDTSEEWMVRHTGRTGRGPVQLAKAIEELGYDDSRAARLAMCVLESVRSGPPKVVLGGAVRSRPPWALRPASARAPCTVGIVVALTWCLPVLFCSAGSIAARAKTASPHAL